MIGEYDATSIAEYIYFGSTPIALYQNGQLFFIHTDHLETPRAITNTSGSLVWKWDNTDPFGKNAPVNLGIDFNLRFTGQYFDNETGLFYNYYRYYNPNIGRYMQADPIGINGGVDTYGYVGNNPINAVDPLGLKPVQRENCKALLKLVEYERKSKLPLYFSLKYNPFSMSEDMINLNASFESIGGNVDIDWMLRSRVVPIPGVTNISYKALKMYWNFMNGSNLDAGMEEEGHKNAPVAANYMILRHKSIKEMFPNQLKKCECMLNEK